MKRPAGRSRRASLSVAGGIHRFSRRNDASYGTLPPTHSGWFMPVADEVTCDRCRGKAKFQLEASPHDGHPGGLVYVCDRCGNVIWLKRGVQQQQQQPPPKPKTD
jgi:hypothetical protein